jgi:hypothetical protein
MLYRKEHIVILVARVSGRVLPLLGKQPPDTHVWILGGDAPAFVKSEGRFTSAARSSGLSW